MSQKSEQLPIVMNPDSSPNYHADFFQGRIINGFLSVGYGIGYPDVANDTQGNKINVYSVKIDGRLFMTLDAAERLQDVLKKMIDQAKKEKEKEKKK